MAFLSKVCYNISMNQVRPTNLFAAPTAEELDTREDHLYRDIAHVQTVRNGVELKIIVGTDCAGGDRTRTVFLLKNKSGVCWDIKAGKDDIKLELYGDWEAEALLESLRFAVFTLEGQRRTRYDK